MRNYTNMRSKRSPSMIGGCARNISECLRARRAGSLCPAGSTECCVLQLERQAEYGCAAIHRAFYPAISSPSEAGLCVLLKGLINSNDELSLLGRLSHQDISERDPYTARDAYQAFKAVVKYYPSSPYAMDAAQRM